MRSRSAFTLVELLVVIAHHRRVVGIADSGSSKRT